MLYAPLLSSKGGGIKTTKQQQQTNCFWTDKQTKEWIENQITLSLFCFCMIKTRTIFFAMKTHLSDYLIQTCSHMIDPSEILYCMFSWILNQAGQKTSVALDWVVELSTFITSARKSKWSKIHLYDQDLLA